MALTTTKANSILDELTGVSPSATRYVALFTAAPTDAGGGTEVSGGSYARQVVAFDAAASRATSNTDTETWPTATANWGTVVAVAIMDASTAGNMLWWSALTTSRTVNSGEIYEMAAGALDLAFSAS